MSFWGFRGLVPHAPGMGISRACQNQTPEALGAPAWGGWRVRAAPGCLHSPALKQTEVGFKTVA